MQRWSKTGVETEEEKEVTYIQFHCEYFSPDYLIKQGVNTSLQSAICIISFEILSLPAALLFLISLITLSTIFYLPKDLTL